MACGFHRRGVAWDVCVVVGWMLVVVGRMLLVWGCQD